MPGDPRKLLHDVASAAGAIAQFSRDRSLAEYEADAMLRSACERQFEIIGEALTRLRDRHPDAFAKIPEGHAIIAFRNRIIHGYDTVDSAIVWDLIETKLSGLAEAAQQLLEDKR
jgi:uncharacterized protein with HEPN domain